MRPSWCILMKEKRRWCPLIKLAEEESFKCHLFPSFASTLYFIWLCRLAQNKWRHTCFLTRVTASIKAALLGSRAVGVHLTGFYAGCRRVFSGNGTHSFLGLWNDNNNCTVKHGSRSARKHETSNQFFPHLLWKRSSRPRGVCKCCQISWHCEPLLRRLSEI